MVILAQQDKVQQESLCRNHLQETPCTAANTKVRGNIMHLTSEQHPWSPVKLEDFYLSQVQAFATEEDEPDEVSQTRKNRQLRHLRRVQSVNFIERAVIRIHDLFDKNAA